MQISDFRRVLTAFADNPADIDLAAGRLLVQIRDEVIVGGLVQRQGELWVTEDDMETKAAEWLIKRVARLPTLADRILTYVDDPENFVTPSGRLLDQLDYSSATDDDVQTGDAVKTAQEVLGRRPAGTSSVLYLTSDAGEGKTTLINHLARLQATLYKEKRTDWLLIPVTLGGRAFLRFDDVVVASMVNRLRFQLFYYEAFIELVRMGVVVPAFDGFEEMFVESSTGEALSALGNLMRSLESSGSVLIAARKAYFEYQSFATQARLFDAIGQYSVTFARVALDRWRRDQFLEYCERRQLADPAALHDAVAARFSADHPLLTRAVLVKRLVDVAATLEDGVEALAQQLGTVPEDYFFQFVNTIIEREAADKWIDRSGEPIQQLLLPEEHHVLLAAVAQEMWISSTDTLRADVLDIVADIFSESHAKGPVTARQIRERLKQHSLIAVSDRAGNLFAFDHEDFRQFFLGEALGRALISGDEADLRQLLRVASLPAVTCDAAVHIVQRLQGDLRQVRSRLQGISKAELPSSFARENCGALAIRLLETDGSAVADVAEMGFPPDSLKGRQITNARFVDCHFQPTSLANTRLEGCSFRRCRFDRLEVAEGIAVGEAALEQCEITSLLRFDHDDRIFDPEAISSALEQYGFKAVRRGTQRAKAITEADDETRLVERAFRVFLRSSHVNENLFRTRLGVKANTFMANLLPTLLRVGVLEEIPYLGKGQQRRFKLGVPMQQIDAALRESRGRFDIFVSQF